MFGNLYLVPRIPAISGVYFSSDRWKRLAKRERERERKRAVVSLAYESIEGSYIPVSRYMHKIFDVNPWLGAAQLRKRRASNKRNKTSRKRDSTREGKVGAWRRGESFGSRERREGIHK